MHAARIEKSDRLNRVAVVLRTLGVATTRDIQQTAYVCAVNSCISELRANGFQIDCKCVGRGRFEYRLRG
jgi:hypothetical protein